MKLFQCRTQVCGYETVKAFVEDFHVGEGDFILISGSAYRNYFEGLELKAEVVLKSKYGEGEPSDEMIDALFKDCRGKNYRRIIAVGGGAVMDMAKLLVLQDGASAEELFAHKVPFVKTRELVLVPTTCGSGSEVSNVCIAEFKAKQTKLGLATDELYGDYAVLIPELLTKLPYRVFVASAIDALIHAVESYVSPKASPFTEQFSISAAKLILNGFMEILEKGPDHRLKLLEDFLIASNYAGIAFGNAGTGAVHATSYPLSGVYHVTHGEANYQMFSAVFQTYQRICPDGKLAELNLLMAEILGCETTEVYVALERVLDQLLKRQPLREYGMKESEIEAFADNVLETQQRLLGQSYVTLTREDLVEIYRKVW